MEKLAQILIMFHVVTGAIALLAGVPALIAKKGSPTHVLSGLFFFWGMLTSSLVGLVVSQLPDHESIFLFVIAVFSSFLIITGWRSLKMKKDSSKINLLDHIVTAAMVVAAIFMLYTGGVSVAGDYNMGWVLLVFGGIGGALVMEDIKLFYRGGLEKSNWMVRHLVRMIGGYIAATTAFVVVNELLPSLVGWLAPTIIGTFLIIYHARKNSK